MNKGTDRASLRLSQRVGALIQARGGWTWSVWQLAQVDLGATYCARVTFEGADYESTIAGNVWSPAAYPQGWRKL